MSRFSRIIHLGLLVFLCYSTCLTAGFSIEEQLNQLRENYVCKTFKFTYVSLHIIVWPITSNFMKDGPQE